MFGRLPVVGTLDEPDCKAVSLQRIERLERGGMELTCRAERSIRSGSHACKALERTPEVALICEAGG